MTRPIEVIKREDVAAHEAAKKVEQPLSDVLKSLRNEYKRRSRSLEAEMLRRFDEAIAAAKKS